MDWRAIQSVLSREVDSERVRQALGSWFVRLDLNAKCLVAKLRKRRAQAQQR